MDSTLIREEDFEGEWLVLRKPIGDAGLARVIARIYEIGLRVWNPTFRNTARPKHRRKSGGGSRASVLPGYLLVWTGGRSSDELLVAVRKGAATEVKALADADRVPYRVPGAELLRMQAAIAAYEALTAPRAAKLWLPRGTPVKIKSGLLEASEGVVEGREGSYQVVAIAKSGIRVKIPPFLLEQITSKDSKTVRVASPSFA